MSISGARRVCEYVADLSPPERISALARVGENSLTIAWVHHSLTERCASYRYALEHLTVAEPAPVAAEAEHILTELQQQIAAQPGRRRRRTSLQAARESRHEITIAPGRAGIARWRARAAPSA